jgi:hypothetical protein
MQRSGALAQEVGDLAHHVVVVGVALLHRLRLHAAHVHQADAAARMRGDEIERARLAQRLDVVDDVDAELERGAHHLGLVAVDRDRHAERHRGTQHRQHARQLILERHRLGAGPARLAADVENVGAVPQQALAVRDGTARTGVPAAVRKRIRRDVDDAHHARAVELDAKARRIPRRKNGA